MIMPQFPFSLMGQWLSFSLMGQWLPSSLEPCLQNKFINQTTSHKILLVTNNSTPLQVIHYTKLHQFCTCTPLTSREFIFQQMGNKNFHLSKVTPTQFRKFSLKHFN